MKSLKNKFLLYFILPLIFIGVSYFVVAGIIIKKNFINYAQNEALVNSRRIGMRLQDGLISKNSKTLSSILFEEKSVNKSISYMEVFDENGNRIADTFLGEDVGGNVLQKKDDSIGSKENFFFQNVAGNNFLVVDESLDIGIKKIGSIRLQFDFSKIENDFSRANTIFFGLGFVFLQLAVFAAIRFSFSVLTPLNKLTEMAGEYSKGNFKKKTGINSNDEIGRLAGAFDFMAQNLDKYNIGIKKEQEKVAEKIEELEKWQHSTMERELKMIELKKKIEELELKYELKTK